MSTESPASRQRTTDAQRFRRRRQLPWQRRKILPLSYQTPQVSAMATDLQQIPNYPIGIFLSNS